MRIGQDAALRSHFLRAYSWTLRKRAQPKSWLTLRWKRSGWNRVRWVWRESRTLHLETAEKCGLQSHKQRTAHCGRDLWCRPKPKAQSVCERNK